MKNYLDYTKLQEFTTKLTAKLKTIFATKADVGTPLVAQQASEMTDTSKIYVYTGLESGYTSGDWYYYNGTSWQSGGVYNSTAFRTDTSLTYDGMAADAQAVGSKLRMLEGDVDGIYNVALPNIRKHLDIKFDRELDYNEAWFDTLQCGDSWILVLKSDLNTLPANIWNVINGRQVIKVCLVKDNVEYDISDRSIFDLNPEYGFLDTDFCYILPRKASLDIDYNTCNLAFFMFPNAENNLGNALISDEVPFDKIKVYVEYPHG